MVESLIPDPPAPGPTVEGRDGTTLTTWDMGGSGPPVLLVHATGFHAWTWLPLAVELRRWHRVWALDQRGHGTSGHPPSRSYLDWSLFGSDLTDTVDALGLDRPLGVGHSLGGAALLLAEHRRPGTFSSLYCYEPIVFTPGMLRREPGNPLASLARKRREHFSSARAAIDNFAGKLPFSRFAPGVVEAYVAHGFEEQPDGSVSLRLPGEEEATVYEGAPLHDAYAHLATTALPVTVAGGDVGGDSGPGAVVDELAGRLPAGTGRHFATLSHFGPLEDPELVAADIAAASRAGRSTGAVPPAR